MTIIVRLAAAFSLLMTADALTCEASQGQESSCNTAGHSNVCFYSNSGDHGCLPTEYIHRIFGSEAACGNDFCWCMTDNCNTNAWFTEFKQTYVPPPQCFTGIAGANNGPTCEKSQLYLDTEYKKPDCHSRGISKMCIENNKHMGMGDGCTDHNDQSACEGDSRSRGTDYSYDGTSNYCRWIPERTKNEKKDNCEVDNGCTYYPDRGHCEMQGGVNVCAGNCESSDSANNNETIWKVKRGKDCEDRTKTGCFENNAHLGEADRCTNHKDESACITYIGDQSNHCSEGSCSGSSTDSTPCAEKTSETWCTGGGSTCTWKKQCCTWLPTPADLADTCLNSGKGSLDGVCQFNDGNGPPNKATVEMGFENSLMYKHDKYVNQCSMIASFRVGFGSAVALGSDKQDLLGANCQASATWKDVSEHVGHTTDSIDEYCANFVPDNSTMSAFAQYRPGYIIEKVKEGQFSAVFPGLQHLLYIVTAKPEFGECLFTAEKGKWGVGVCTCEGVGCNNQTALEFVVDKDKGPMRLLQFIDGSLSDLKDEINGVVSGLMNAEGKLNSSNVNQVTEANVDAIMLLDGVSNKTGKDELWGIVQDYQALLSAEATYKQSLLDHYAFKPLQIDALKVAQANTAAVCELYGKDGVPNTVCLQSLSPAKIDAVSNITGIAVADLMIGKLTSEKLELGTPLALLTSTTMKTSTTTTTSTTTPLPAAADVKITGDMTLQVPNADAFMQDDDAKTAVRDGIADHVGVSPNRVALVFTKGQRRLHGEQKVRKLTGSSLLVRYTITVPATAGASKQADVEQKVTDAVTSTTALNDAISAKISAAKGNAASTFAVTVASIAAPTVTTPRTGTASNAFVNILSPVALIIAALGSQFQ